MAMTREWVLTNKLYPDLVYIVDLFQETCMKIQNIQRWRVTAFRGSTGFILIFFLLLFSGCKEKPKQLVPAPSPPVVSVIQVTPKDVPVTFTYVARTQSSQLVNIQARVNGYLDKRVYTEGMIVEAGDVLFLLDAKPFKAALDQALALLAQKKATYEAARLDYGRTKALVEQKVKTPKDLDDATGKYLAAQAAVQQASAEVKSASLNLSYTTITSPVAGITGSAHQTEGTYINQTNNQLTEVTVLSPMWINFSLTESEMLKYRSQITKGLLQRPEDGKYTVEVILADETVFPHTGEITFAEPSYSSQTGTFLVRTSVDNPDGILRPNQNVHVRLNGAIRPNSILVPQRAVQEGSKGQFVWVVDKQSTVNQRPVKVGNWNGDDWFIEEGLMAGEQVAVDGLLKLQAGMTVTPNPLEAGTVAPASGEVKVDSAAAGGK